MPQETKLMPFPDSVDDLLQQLEDLFEEPYQHECNCGKDPEGCCDFCSTFERSRNKARKLMEAWNTSPTSPTSPDWIKEASEEIEMRSASLARAIVSTENLDQSKVEPLTFAIRNVMKEILTKHAAGLVEDKERLDWLQWQNCDMTHPDYITVKIPREGATPAESQRIDPNYGI